MKLGKDNSNDILDIAENWLRSSEAKRVDVELTDKVSGENYFISLIKLSLSVVGRFKNNKNIESLLCFETLSDEEN